MKESFGVKFIGLTLVILFLVVFNSPIVLGQQTLPATIEGVPIPSQGKEGDYYGYFLLSNITQISGVQEKGVFTANIIYSFNGGPGPERQLFIIGEVYGVFKIQKDNIMMQFLGTGFRGQLHSISNGLIIGFINTPGNGFLSQVFVAGSPA